MRIEIRHEIEVDDCIADEILILNGMGIQTLYCCCGHGNRHDAFIDVKTDHRDKMRELGYKEKQGRFLHKIYRQYPKSRVRYGDSVHITFLPKSKCQCHSKVVPS